MFTSWFENSCQLCVENMRTGEIDLNYEIRPEIQNNELRALNTPQGWDSAKIVGHRFREKNGSLKCFFPMCNSSHGTLTVKMNISTATI